MVTTLADYCHQRGWKVLKEYVDIAAPTGKELKQFLEYMRHGKIIVVSSDSQRKEGKHGE